MRNYSTWPAKKIKVTSLRLDVENPRLSEPIIANKSQSKIIDYLIDKEKVFELAKRIIAQGYLPNESPIVVKESGKFHVLEGNRRVSACKILINPDLIKSSVRRNNLKRLLKDFDLSIVEKLEVIIAPSRSEADVMIVNRHTGGSAVEKWDKTKQDRFFYSRFNQGETIEEISKKFSLTQSEIKKILKRYNVYEEVVNIEFNEEKITKALNDETTFNMTSLERVYQNDSALKFLGIEFDENNFSLTKKLPKEEFTRRISKVVEDVVNNKINSRILNTKEDTDKYIKKLSESGEYDMSIIPNVDFNNEYQSKKEDNQSDKPSESTVGNTSKRKTTSTTKLIPPELHLVSGVERIDKIFAELKTLHLTKQPNAVAVLFRSYLDMVVYQFLKTKNNLNEIKKEEIEHLLKEADKKWNKAKKELEKLSIDIESIGVNEEDFKKAIGIKTVLTPKKIPSLKYMLSFMAKSDGLITDERLKQALIGYVGKNTKLLGHNEYNLLVHNEYYTTDSKELKLVWDQMQPLIEFLISEIK